MSQSLRTGEALEIFLQIHISITVHQGDEKISMECGREKESVMFGGGGEV